MKKNLFKLVISLIFVVMTLVCLSVFMLTDASALDPASGFDGGAGTSGNPYQIATPAQWLYFANYINEKTHNGEYFKLTADITFNTGDASTWGSSPPSINLANHNGNDYRVGKKCNEDYPFQGTFDGDGHVISGVYMSVSGGTVGLFGSTAKGYTATIKNLVVTNSYFNSPDGEVGALVGQTSGGTTTLSSVFITHTVYIVSGGNAAGGCIGHNGGNGYLKAEGNSYTQTYQKIVVNDSVSGAIITSSGTAVGGFLGNGNGGIIQFADDLSYSKVSGVNYCGGLAGRNDYGRSNSKFTRCMNIFRPTRTSGSDTFYCYHIQGFQNGSSSTANNPTITDCVAWGSLARRLNDKGNTIVDDPYEDATNADCEANMVEVVRNGDFLTREGNYGAALLNSSSPYWVEVASSITIAGQTISFKEFCFPKAVCEMVHYNYNLLNTGNRTGTSISDSGHTFLNSSSISIANETNFVRFIQYFNGYYKEPCLNGASGKTITLGANLSLNTGSASSYGSSAPTNVYVPIGNGRNPFRGTFNGNNKKISGFYVCTDSDFDAGTAIFSQAENATISNLIIDNSCFKSERRKVSALVGEIIGTTNISNIYVTNSVYVIAQYGTRAGIVSTLNDRCSSTISNCVNEATISVLSETAGDQNYCGGIIGNGNTGLITINDCLNLSAINGNNFIGGIAGSIANDSSRVNRCVNLGEVATNNNYGQVSNSGTAGTHVYFTNCFGITAAVGGRNTSGSYTQITLATFIYPGFLSDAGSALASNWTARSSATDNGNNTTTYVLELCVPSGVSGFAPRSVYYNTYTLSNFSFEGSGTDVDPYIITTVAEFNELAEEAQSQNFSGLYIVLGNNITVNAGTSSSWLTSFSGTKLTPIGTESVPFCGNFDGQGYTISGAYMTQNVGGAGYGMGIFGVIGNGAVVKNFKIVNSCFVDEEWVGAVVGEMKGGTIDNIYVSSDVYVKATVGGCVGGIAGGGTGTNTDPRVIQNCVFKGSVTATTTAGMGGILGLGQGKALEINNCLMTGTLSCAAGTENAGGIVGYNNYATTITNTVYAGSGSVKYPIGDFYDKVLTISGCYSTSSASNQYKSSATGSAGVMKMPSATNYYTSGTGTSVDPYIINNWGQLVILAYETYFGTDSGFSGKYFKLNADIEINEGTAAEDWTPNNVFIPIGYSTTAPFRGNFDGNKKTISGLYVVTDHDKGTGLFGTVENATISNLIITNSSINNTASYKSAALVGQLCGDCTISNIYVTDSVYVTALKHNTGGVVGGLETVGASGHVISNCVNAAHLKTTSSTNNDRRFIGGIVGNGNGKKVTINDCLNIADISGHQDVAGIMGRNSSSSVVINRCVNLGNITSDTGSTTRIVQIAASSDSEAKPTLNDCFGITSTFGSNTTNNRCVTITVDDFITNGFLAGTGSTLASNWTNRAGSEISFCGTTIASDAREICIPNGLSSFTLPASAFYGKAPEWLLEAYEDGTFTVSTKADYGELVKFINNDYSFNANGLSGKTVELGDDISFNTGSASGWNSLAPTNVLNNYMLGTNTHPFKGTFDGQGNTISGFYTSTTHGDGTGIFGLIVNGTVTDLVITNSYFYTSKNTVGALAGQISGDTNISKVYVTDSVYVTANGYSGSANAGGIVGHFDSSADQSEGHAIEYCVNAATVKSQGGAADDRINVGGIVGNFNNKLATINSCMNVGAITGSYYVGGIVGRCDGYGNTATITNCVNIGNLKADTSVNNSDIVGQIAAGNCVGTQTVTITNCYGLGSNIYANRVDGTSVSSNLSVTGGPISFLTMYGSSATASISGFSKRANDLMIPTGCPVPDEDKFFNIRMENGAQIRLSDPTGIRFIAEINISAYGGVEAIDEYGILYGPTSKVSDSGFNPASLTLKTDYVKVPSQVCMKNGDGSKGYYKFALAVNVAPKNYNVKFSARAYITLKNGNTIYSDYIELNNSRSVADIARIAIEDVSTSTSGGYTGATVGTLYSCYTADERAILQKYFRNEVRVMYIEMSGSSNKDTDFANKAVKEIYKYQPDVVALVGAKDMSAVSVEGYSVYGLGNSTTATRRILYKTSKFGTALATGDISDWGVYAKLEYDYTDPNTGAVSKKSSYYAAIDNDMTSADSTIKNNATFGNGKSVGLIVTGYFKGDAASNDTIKNGYLTDCYSTALTKYYDYYFTKHSSATMLSGSIYKADYADAVRYRISTDAPFDTFSNHYAVICDYILK